MDKTLKKILERITPTEEEHVKEKRIVEKISKKLEKFDVKPILVGSLAKGTDIKGDKDLDIFIMFHKDVPRRELEERGLSIGKTVLEQLGVPHEIDYAEHPYVKGSYNGYDVEIVPCYDTKECQSAVDRTPYHTYYVKKKLSKNRGMNDEIRVLKQFMKGIGVYGAEAKVEGFSGYLTELLVINYGSFREVLDAASEWKFGAALDPENLWKDKKTLKYFFTNADLIIVDPTDMNRNTAAAVSRQRMAEFISACRDFVNDPSTEYFFPKEKEPAGVKELEKRLEERGTRLIGVSLAHEKINPNTLYAQLRKSRDSLEKEMQLSGFSVLKSDVWTDEANRSIITLEFEVHALPAIKRHTGPPVDSALKEQEKFRKKYEKNIPYIDGGRWVVDTLRKYRNIDDLIPVLSRERKGFGKDLREKKVNIEIIEGKDLFRIKDKGYLKCLDRFLTPV